VAQLLAAGLSREVVKKRVQRGGLHRVHRGVYQVGHQAPSVEAWYIAAVLACGHGAVLSGMAAATLYGLVRERSTPEVTALRVKRIPGVFTHRARLHRRDVSRHKGIPITTVPRTLVDIAGHFELDPFAALCHEAQIRYR
jgi:predicted transcriptional regulator of viral defense system